MAVLCWWMGFPTPPYVSDRKCTRMRCEQVKNVSRKSFKRCYRPRPLIVYQGSSNTEEVRRKYKRLNSNEACAWAPDSTIVSTNPPAMLEATIKCWKQHRNDGEARSFKAWSSAVESTLHLCQQHFYSNARHLWVLIVSMHTWFLKKGWCRMKRSCPLEVTTSAIKYGVKHTFRHTCSLFPYFRCTLALSYYISLMFVEPLNHWPLSNTA